MTTFTRRQFLGATGAALTLPLAAHGQGNNRRPNIIFILADDLGYGDLGCYGQKTIHTPRIDRMASEGMRFTQCYAGSTVCAPSRCVLMTGLHTGHCRVRGNRLIPLEPEDVTVAEVLKDAGYRTALIGKWGLGEPDTTGVPNRQGFDYFFGYLNQRNAHNYYPEYIWKNEEKYPLEGNVCRDDIPQVSIEREQYTHDLFAEDALRYVEENKDDPFFLYLAFTIPHANNERGREDGVGMEVPDYGPYEDRDWDIGQKGHAAMITRMDRDVGRLLDKLEELGIADNTLVIFTSDNGPHQEGGADPEFFDSNGVMRGIKRDLYEGGIRVPGIAWWPGEIEAGSVSREIWAFWDFMPTAAELAGAEVSGNLDGISIVPALKGGELDREKPLYWEFHERGFSQALQWDDWKIVKPRHDKPIELYNLLNDPGETNDLADRYPDVITFARDYLVRSRTDSREWPAREG
jgi:arylsulfatase A-like enzyme